jgi:hypothetical protein
MMTWPCGCASASIFLISSARSFLPQSIVSSIGRSPPSIACSRAYKKKKKIRNCGLAGNASEYLEESFAVLGYLLVASKEGQVRVEPRVRRVVVTRSHVTVYLRGKKLSQWLRKTGESDR